MNSNVRAGSSPALSTKTSSIEEVFFVLEYLGFGVNANQVLSMIIIQFVL